MKSFASLLLLILTPISAVSAQSGAEDAGVNSEMEVLASDGQWERLIDLATVALSRNPEDVAALYWRGIAHREREKSFSILTRAVADLELAVNRDSLFRDVLYQYGLTLSYRQQYPRDLHDAINYAERQLRLNPKLESAQLGILRIYEEYVRARGPSDAIRWLREHESPHARFAQAQALRRARRLIEADEILAGLMMGYPAAGPTVPPIQPILLARARIHYEMGKPERAQPFVVEAIRSIDSHLAAQFVFNDFKYVVTAEELSEFEGLTRTEAFQSFFAKLWIRRDPAPASAVNLRLAEHYRRLLYAEKNYVFTGFRAWFNEPVDHAIERGFTEADLPVTYALAAEFDDRGVIYIRHGEPAAREYYRGPGLDAESWQYNEPEMDFHFASSTSGKGVGNYRLRPTPPRQLAPNLMNWDGKYIALAKDWERNEELVIRESTEQLQVGLSTDRYTSPDALEIPIPFHLAFFRAPAGATLVSLYYAFPVGQLSKGDLTDDSVSVEAGFSLHDLDWTPFVLKRDVKRMNADVSDPDAAAIDVFHAVVRPDSYHVALHVRSEVTNHLGANRLIEWIPVFSGPALSISSLVPAYDVTAATGPGRYTKGRLTIRANPMSRFDLTQPVYFYYETYGLTFGPDDSTHYTVEYTWRLRAEKKGLANLLRSNSNEVVLSLSTSGSGSDRTLIEYPSFDVSRLKPGEYTFEVVVTDGNTGTSVQQEVEVSLYR